MDYTKRAALLCCTSYIALLLLSLIPPLEVCGVELRRANILSDLAEFSADNIVEEIELVIDETEYEVDLEKVEQEVMAIEVSDSRLDLSYQWGEPSEDFDPAEFEQNDEGLAAEPGAKGGSYRLLEGVAITPIEDYDSTDNSAMKRLYSKLLDKDSLVRIAVLGDSFIEADIITADLREALQTTYGGCGVGFAPIDSPLTKYRSTIKTTSSGWTTYNVMQHRKTPEPLTSNFSVSGWVSQAQAGATTTWTTTSARNHIDSCQCVRLQFMALKPCKLIVSINEGEPRSFDLDGGSYLRQIELNHNNITSLSVRIAKGAEGFIGYGAYFEGSTGVLVDNYSVRSNNGQAMFWTSAAVNAQIDKALGGYDLVILQYGLNIMQSGVNKYTSYGAQVEKMILYARQCFPRAAVVVMGVSDRSFKKAGIYQPMGEAINLTEFQRNAARNQGACFWETYDAMQQQGGMSKFVANGWAGKDFTHINLKGGRQIAWAMADALGEGVNDLRKQMVQRVEYPPLIDSADRVRIEQNLMKSDN